MVMHPSIMNYNLRIYIPNLSPLLRVLLLTELAVMTLKLTKSENIIIHEVYTVGLHKTQRFKDPL